MPSKQAFLNALFKAGPFVYLALLFSTFVDQWITRNLHALLMSQDGVGIGIWIYGLISIANSFLLPVFAFVFVVISQKESTELSNENYFKKCWQEFNQVLIEFIRTWGKCLAWGFLFIIPGIVKWFRLIFVPFIVLLDPAYRRGEKDALEESEKLTHGQFSSIFVLFFVFSLLLPFIMTSFDQYKTLVKTPISALFLLIFESIFLITFILLLLKLYKQVQQKSQQG
jgi:hypothetical protein